MRALILVALFALAGAAAAPAAEPGGAARPSIRPFLEIRTPSAPTMLRDGSLLLRNNPDGIMQLYRVIPRRGADGARSYRPQDTTSVRLTDFADGLSDYTLSPDGHHVVLMFARGGNENTQLALMDLDRPRAPLVPVLADPAVQAHVDAWLADGSAFIYSANRDSPTDFYLYRYDLATAKHSRLLSQPGSWNAVDATRDGTRLLVVHEISASDQRSFELDVASGALRDLTMRPAGGGTAASAVVGYLPDERSVMVLSDFRDGTQRLFVRDLGSGAVREPLPRTPNEVESVHRNPSRTCLAVDTNQDGYRSMALYALPSFRAVALPPMERGFVSAANLQDSTVVWTASNARTPASSYATSIAGGRAGATVQLTWSDTRGLDLSSLPLPRLVRYPAFDRRQIPAFLYLPPGYTERTAIPFVVFYHGGPEGQNRPQFSATTQYFIAHGYGVLAPNVRGSTGYGRAFQMLDDYRRRWDSVRDGVDAAEWLVKNGYARPGRIATFGGSYGGFMAVACIVEDQDRVDRGLRRERLFGACVDNVGIVNLQTFLAKTSGYRRKLREAEYGPLADSTFLASVSSIHRVDQIRVPVFIGHGFNDPRVPVEEAMQLAIALKERGRAPRLFIAPDEGHGFVKLDNRVYFYERVAQFLDETIGGMAPRDTGAAAAGAADDAR